MTTENQSPEHLISNSVLIDYSILNEADQTLHSLAQLLALTAMQALPAQADDSQANLLWNPDHHRLEGRSFAVAGQRLRLVVDLNTFSLHFVDEQEHTQAQFMAENRTPDEALRWWQSQMASWGVAITKPVNYTLTQEPVATQTPYQRPVGLPAWAYWRTVANRTLTTLNGVSGRESEVRVWPHHFDTGIYHSLPDATGQERAAIWAGYSIADSLSDAPYFYLSGYVRDQVIDFAAAPPLPVGTWRIAANWTGALLPVSFIRQATDVDLFLNETYRWLHQVVA